MSKNDKDTMGYFEALEFERNRLEEKIPFGFFDDKPEMSMINLIDECYELAHNLYIKNPTPGGKLEEVLDEGLDGYLPYCGLPDGRTSLFNIMGYNVLVHEYNLWVLYGFLKEGGRGELEFIPTIPKSEDVDKLCGL